MQFAIVLALVTVGASIGPDLSAAQGNVNVSRPEIQPVIVWFNAIKNGDQEALKTAFSERMRQQFDEIGWAKVLMMYQDGFKQVLGDFKLEDFAFEFTGGEDSGHVAIAHKGTQLPAVQVLREKTGWRVNER